MAPNPNLTLAFVSQPEPYRWLRIPSRTLPLDTYFNPNLSLGSVSQPEPCPWIRLSTRTLPLDLSLDSN